MPSAPRYNIHECLAQIKSGDSLHHGLNAWAAHVSDWADATDKKRTKLLPQELAAFDALHLVLMGRSGFFELLTNGNGLNQFIRGHRALQTIKYEAGVSVTAPVYALLERLGVPENGKRDDWSLFELPAKIKWQQRSLEEARKAGEAVAGNPYNPHLEVTDPDDFDAVFERLRFLTWPSHAPWREVEWGIFPAVASCLEANAPLLECRKK